MDEVASERERVGTCCATPYVSVTRFEWSLLAWPQDPAPALEVPEPGWACLTPASAGNYRVALRVTNSCGATGGPAEVSMQVGP